MSALSVRRLLSHSVLALPLAAMLLSACAGQGDVSRVQPDVVEKAIFFNEDGSPLRLESSGLLSKVSSWLGPPDM